MDWIKVGQLYYLDEDPVGLAGYYINQNFKALTGGITASVSYSLIDVPLHIDLPSSESLTYYLSNTHPFGKLIGFQTPTVNHNLQSNFDGTAGSYTLKVLYARDTFNGVVRVDINGAPIGTFDGYNASHLDNQTYTNPSVTLLDGLNTLNLTVTSKNIGSSDFQMMVSHVWLIRN